MDKQEQIYSAGSLDQDVVNLAKAIRQSESGGDYSAKGSSGEFGAYQFTKPTWEKQAVKYGINVPLEKSTREQQNEVAYRQLKEWKDKGFNPGQIASMWNAGEGEPDAYTGKFSDGSPSMGTNKFGVKFNVPQYARSVAEAYHKIKGGQQVSPDPNNPSSVMAPQYITQSDWTKPKAEIPQGETPETPGLGQQLSERSKDLASAVTAPDISLPSRAIQAAGAVAGGLGDIVSAGLNVATFGLLNKLTGVLGKGVSALANTEVGKSVVNSVNEFSQKHPELSKDIEAGVNIISAIPILKGFSLAKGAILDASASRLKDVAEKSMAKELTSVVSKTKTGAKLIEKLPEGVKTLVRERAIPDVENVGGKLVYSSKEAKDTLRKAITNIDETELQPALEGISVYQVTGGKQRTLAELKKLAVNEAKSDTFLKEAGMVPKALKQIDNRFAGWKASYGDRVDIATQNRLKIGTGKFTDWGTPEGSADKAIYRALQKDIENTARDQGYGNLVNSVNARMQEMIRAEDLLNVIDRKPVKTGGLVSGLIRDVSTVGGEAAGNIVGTPMAGALVGRGAASKIGGLLDRISPTSLRGAILERTGPEAVVQPVRKTATKAASGLLRGALINKANR